jgi:hypothetical protein
MRLQWTIPSRPQAAAGEPGHRLSGAPRMPRAQVRPAGEPPAEEPTHSALVDSPAGRRRQDVAIGLTTWRARLALLAPVPGVVGPGGPKR